MKRQKYDIGSGVSSRLIESITVSLLAGVSDSTDKKRESNALPKSPQRGSRELQEQDLPDSASECLALPGKR